jgi:hypothetical protein
VKIVHLVAPRGVFGIAWSAEGWVIREHELAPECWCHPEVEERAESSCCAPVRFVRHQAMPLLVASDS